MQIKVMTNLLLECCSCETSQENPAMDSTRGTAITGFKGCAASLHFATYLHGFIVRMW